MYYGYSQPKDMEISVKKNHNVRDVCWLNTKCVIAISKIKFQS